MSYAAQNLAKGFKLILFIFLISGCASTPGPDLQSTTATNKQALSVRTAEAIASPGLLALGAARKMLGVPYRYGGKDPRGFDCSGLVQYSFKKAGIKVPRTSQDLFRSSHRVPLEDMRPGDLVFFTISSDKISHVGIYDERKRFIHAPSSGKGVSYANLENPYWSQRIIAVGRF
jgi:cell wall-associated NlpC family hydrolase